MQLMQVISCSDGPHFKTMNLYKGLFCPAIDFLWDKIGIFNFSGSELGMQNLLFLLTKFVDIYFLNIAYDAMHLGNVFGFEFCYF